MKYKKRADYIETINELTNHLDRPKILNISCRRKDELRQILSDLLKDGINDINGLSDNISIQGEEIQTV